MKKKTFSQKNASHTISLIKHKIAYQQQKIFPSNIDVGPKKILVFFLPKIECSIETHIFQKVFACKIFCVYNVVLVTLILDFFSFSL